MNITTLIERGKLATYFENMLPKIDDNNLLIFMGYVLFRKTIKCHVWVKITTYFNNMLPKTGGK